MKMYFYNHPYHIVTSSPWPPLISLSMCITMIGSIKMFNYMNYMLMTLGFYMIILISFQWWRDVIRESTFQGLHTLQIRQLLSMAMFLFILSELLFFISFFYLIFILPFLLKLKLKDYDPLKMLINLILMKFLY